MFASLRARSSMINMLSKGTHPRMGFRSAQPMQKKISVGEYVSALEKKISGISQIVSISHFLERFH